MGDEKAVQSDRLKIEDVLKILKKNAALTVKQEKFCNEKCIERFLKGKGENVKKAARHLRSCLLWRESIGTDYLIADEFAAELGEGTAYLAGHDQEARPVVVFRIKQDYQKLHSQKRYIRLLVFTLEVAAASMSKGVEQLILLFDASFYRSASAFLALFMATMKILSEFYPGRLHRAFVVDPPTHFSFLWKGARPFVDQWTSTMLVSSSDYDDPTPPECAFSTNPRACSLRLTPPPPPPPPATATNKVGPSSSSRFSFTVSHLDSLKPWYLSKSVPVPVPAPIPTDISPALSPLSGRSLSFASPAGRSCQPSPRTPRPSFLQSPAAFLRRPDSEQRRGDDFFRPYAVFLRRPYSEASYRAMMRPPMAGLVAIVSGQHWKRRPDQQHFSFHSQRFSTIDYTVL